jgi:Spy/CpxP family protein refolding chaperone
MSKGIKLRWVAGAVMAAVAVATVAAGVTHAQQAAGQPGGQAVHAGRGMMGGPGMMRGGRGLAALRVGLAQLNLTEQQKEQVKTILQSHREKAQGLAAQGRDAGRALRESVADGADESTIRAKAADVAKVQADLAVFGAQLRKEILGVLSPEQQARAKELRLKALDRAEKAVQRRKKMLDS